MGIDGLDIEGMGRKDGSAFDGGGGGDGPLWWHVGALAKARNATLSTRDDNRPLAKGWTAQP